VEFGQYLAAAVEKVKEALGGGGVAILVPPGSARGEVAKRLVKEGIVSEDDVFLYEELHKRVGVGRPLRRAGGQFYVGEEPLLSYLKRGVTLRYALRQRKVVIAPRDTWEALLIYKALLEALEEEKTWTIGDVKRFVKVVFLPALYQGKELAEVDYQRTLRGVVKNASGYSPSLQKLAAAEPKLAEEALEVFRALDPGRYFGEGLRPMVVGAAISAGLAPLTTLGAGPLAIAVAAIFSEKWANILAESGKEGLKELLASVFRGGGGDLRQLFASALKALRYVDDQRLEARVDEVAAKWGLTLEGFKDLLHLIAGNVVTKKELEGLKALKDEEFRKAVEELVEERWEKVKRELEERIAALEKEVKELEERTRLSKLFPGPVYIGADEWPYIGDVKGKVWLNKGLLGDGPLVDNSLIDVVAEALAYAARGGGGVVVVKGGKGVGKSSAAAAAVYYFLRGAVRVGERAYKPIAVEVRGAVDRGLLQNFVEAANGFGYFPVLYFDPSMLSAYPEEVGEEYKPEVSVHMVKEVVALLFDTAKPEKRHTVALVALSNDQYKVIEGEILKRVKSGARRRLWVIDADEVLEEERADFVKDLVEKYSDCKGEGVEKVASAIASSFRDGGGYAVAAVLAADWLRGHGCIVREVERAVKEVEGDVHRFALHYIWRWLFNGNETIAKRYVPLLLAVGFFGPHPPKLAEAVVRAFGGEPEDVIVQWFSLPLHGTIFDAIKNFVKCAYKSREGDSAIALCKDNVIQQLIKSIPRELAENGERVVEVFKKKVIEASANLSPLIEDFTKATDSQKLESLGRWVLKSQALGMADEPVEDVYDQLDILLAVLGIADLQVIPLSLVEFVREWISIGRWFIADYREWGGVAGGEPAQALLEYVLTALHADRNAVRSKVAELFYRVRSRGYLTYMDLWEIVGLLRAVEWEKASDEELKFALRLSYYLFREYKFVLPEAVVSSLQRLFKSAFTRLDSVAGELAFLYRKDSIEGLDPWTLYNKVDSVEKVFVLQGLLRQRKIGKDDLDKIENRLRELEKGDIGLLLRLTVYPRLAVHYAEVGEKEKAKVYIVMSWMALSRIGPSIAKLRRLLSPYYSPPEFERWAAELPLYVYINAALAYISLGEVQRGLEIVERVWSFISTSAPNEHIVVKALEAYLVALAYRRAEEFDKAIEEHNEIIGNISSYTYCVLKRLGVNNQKLDEIAGRPDMLVIILSTFPKIKLVLIAMSTTPSAQLPQSEDDRLALVKSCYEMLLNDLLYV